MTNNNQVEFVALQPSHVDELVAMWRTSFEQAVGVIDPHPIEQQRDYLLNEVFPNNEVRIAISTGKIVGFIAASAESIAQLYVHVDHQGNGIGSQLLQWAQDNSNGSLWLYTFENNEAAQRFYERKGFKVVARGFEEQWQLNDIKYEWTGPGRATNQAQAFCGVPKERTRKKVRPYMVQWVQDFVRNSPFAVMASSNVQGHCDASPKGGKPGFIKVIDEKYLVIPDDSGNKLFQTYENLETNSFVGLVFLIPGIDTIARVNGHVKVLRKGDSEFEQVASNVFAADEYPDLSQLILLEVTESYSHCPKSLVRANLWDTSVIANHLTNPPIAKWVPGT